MIDLTNIERYVEREMEQTFAKEDEARTQAKIDFDEYGFWKDRYPNNAYLRRIYQDEFSKQYQLEQNIDHQTQWSDENER